MKVGELIDVLSDYEEDWEVFVSGDMEPVSMARKAHIYSFYDSGFDEALWGEDEGKPNAVILEYQGPGEPW